MVDNSFAWSPTNRAAESATTRRRAHQPDPGNSHNGQAVIEGQVRNVDKRQPINGQAVVHFRVEQFDATGARQRRVSVQHTSFGGPFGKDLAIHEGDRVRVYGRWDNGTVIAQRVENLTTESTTVTPTWVGAHKIQLWVAAAIVATMAISTMVILGLFVWGVSSFDDDTWGSQQIFREQSDRMQHDFCQDTVNAGIDPPSSCDGYLNGTP